MTCCIDRKSRHSDIALFFVIIYVAIFFCIQKVLYFIITLKKNFFFPMLKTENRLLLMNCLGKTHRLISFRCRMIHSSYCKEIICAKEMRMSMNYVGRIILKHDIKGVIPI